MKHSFTFLSTVLALAFYSLSCDKKTEPNGSKIPDQKAPRADWVKIYEQKAFNLSEARVLANDLANPSSPLVHKDQIYFCNSGKGTIEALVRGERKTIIEGFVMDSYGGYQISAQGITIDPESKHWIVAAAEGPGKLFLFDPEKFPTEAKQGREIKLSGAIDDNPWQTIIFGKNPPILVASGGTKAEYQGPLDVINPVPLEKRFEVGTGLIGMAVSPDGKLIYGAVFGAGPKTSTIIRWNPLAEEIEPEVVAKGLSYLLDLAFTPSGDLLALEFGTFGKSGEGRLLLIQDQGKGEVLPLLEGLNSPSSLLIDRESQQLLITEYGLGMNKNSGTLLSFKTNAKN